MANVNMKLINKPNKIIGVINQLRYAWIDNKKNMEKAYDRLEWSFVYKELQAFHFPPNLI